MELNSAQRRAREIRRRYHFSRPSDIERVLKAENVQVMWYPFAGRVKEMIVQNKVGLASSLARDSRRGRELLAHALGHSLMHSGNQPFFHLEHEPVVARQMEHQAWDFAYELLMPADALMSLSRGSWNAVDLREQSEVSEEFFQKRMEVFTEAIVGSGNRDVLETGDK